MVNSGLLLATMDTKAEETGFLKDALAANGVDTEIIDVSLDSDGAIWGGVEKSARIAAIAGDKGAEVSRRIQEGMHAVVALGGGTSGDIILRVMRALPYHFPKVLVTPMPFDPRPAVADNSIILVPSITDIAGLNPFLRQVLSQTAALVAGLCSVDNASFVPEPTIGITALSATGGALDGLVSGLRKLGQEPTVFHANGFGGAAFARFTAAGAFSAAIDMTTHEATRILFEGDHVAMPTRFTAAANIPRVVLPGGLNFLGLGPIHTLTAVQRASPHFQHSGLFTHVKLTPEQMTTTANWLAGELNKATAPTHVVVPMGGFSHRDCQGGEIEDPQLRQICLDTLTARAKTFKVEALPGHINDATTTTRVIEIIRPHI